MVSIVVLPYRICLRFKMMKTRSLCILLSKSSPIGFPCRARLGISASWYSDWDLSQCPFEICPVQCCQFLCYRPTGMTMAKPRRRMCGATLTVSCAKGSVCPQWQGLKCYSLWGGVPVVRCHGWSTRMFGREGLLWRKGRFPFWRKRLLVEYPQSHESGICNQVSL